jgi:hypothetical protein
MLCLLDVFDRKIVDVFRVRGEPVALAIWLGMLVLPVKQ